MTAVLAPSAFPCHLIVQALLQKVRLSVFLRVAGDLAVFALKKE
jgi:hypothetical protein